MATDDFFRDRLGQMIDPRHPLAVLFRRLPWVHIEAALAPTLAHGNRAGEVREESDLFRSTALLALAGVSPAGRPRLPCDPSQVGRFRTAIGEAGVEEILKATIDTVVATKAIRRADFERVIVDSTMQEKAIAYPTDSRLLEVARYQVVKAAKCAGISLKQTFAREGKELKRRAGGYAHAKQFRRLRRVLKRRQAVEPVIGHLKSDNRMDRCWLTGATGDALHTVLCAAGYNLRWLLRAITIARGVIKPHFLAFLAGVLVWLRTMSGTGRPSSGVSAWFTGSPGIATANEFRISSR